MRNLIIGSRGSDLALWQANFVKDSLAAIGIHAEIKIIKTQGDRILNLRLDKLEGKGFFTKELEEELLAETIDLAVHSHKDLPTTHPEGLRIAAVSKRENPADVLLILKDCVDIKLPLSLKKGATVGTSSNRRKAQLLAIRPDLNIIDLRGNVPTRVSKLENEDYDAIMLAKAGISRLGLDLSAYHIEELDPKIFVPAPSQGALAIQIRNNDTELFQVLQAIHDEETAIQIGVEREILHLFEGGCHMPLGAYCEKEGEDYLVWTSKAESDTEMPSRLFLRNSRPEELPNQVMAKFNPNRKLAKKVFISRDTNEHSYFNRALNQHGIEVEARSLIKIFPILNAIDATLFSRVDWVFFSSRNAVAYFLKLNPIFSKKTKFGVVGSGSAEALRNEGIVPHFIGQTADTKEIAREFAELVKGQSVLFPRAKDSLQSIQKGLDESTHIIDLPIYETVILDRVEPSYADILIFTSPSNVDAYFEENLMEQGQQIIAIGESTGAKFKEMNIPYITPYAPDEIGLTEAVFSIDF